MGDRLALSIIGVQSVAIVAVVGVLLLGQEAGGPWRADVAALPALNASLNATSAVLLGVGWAAIRRRRIALHRACMLAACAVSALFLVSYVTYHSLAGSRPFTGQGAIRWVYFPILVSHIVLAAGMVPFADLLGLVVVADAPGRLPKPLRELKQLVSGGVHRMWTVPWLESVRLGESLSLPAAPREVRQMVDELRSLIR